MEIMTEVLIVDDNPADSDLTTDVLRRSNRPMHINVVADGTEGMAFLRQEGKYASAAPPDLVLLDLNLPGRDGRIVLAQLKSDSALRKTPVVVFSTSSDSCDILHCYAIGANSYVTKPGNLPDFISAVTSIGNFWLGHAQLPREERQ